MKANTFNVTPKKEAVKHNILNIHLTDNFEFKYSDPVPQTGRSVKPRTFNMADTKSHTKTKSILNNRTGMLTAPVIDNTKKGIHLADCPPEKRITENHFEVHRDHNVNNLIVTDKLSAKLIYQDGYPILPAGLIMQYAGDKLPGGWLWCDGTVLSKCDYKHLYNAIGNTYTYDMSLGADDFALPNFSGRVPVGTGQGSGLSLRELGDTGGEETHVLTIAEMPSHTHPGTTASNGTHNHGGFTGDTGSAPESESVISTVIAANTTALVAGSNTHNHSIASDGAHTHNFITNATGGSTAHNNMQPYLVVNYIIKY